MPVTSQNQEKFNDYEGFVEKFKPKRTTDDCYTPPHIYDAISSWACDEYGIDPSCIVRPFYPGGDYQAFDYPTGAVVLDNPPFSIISEIVAFYLDVEIPFFLFAPALTAMCSRATSMRCNHIFTSSNVTYENGAKVPTSFVTSFGDCIAQSSPSLRHAIAKAEQRYKPASPELPTYNYPDHVLTSAMLNNLAKNDVELRIYPEQAAHISALDMQKGCGKSIFGGGLLLSDEAAARKSAAQNLAARKSAAINWELSAREREIIASLK